MVLALAAVPFVVFVEGLSDSEFLEAVNESNISLGLFKIINLLPSISRRQCVKEVSGNRRMPDNLELDVFALDLSIVHIESVVALNFAEVHEVLHLHVRSVSERAVVASLLLAVVAFVIISTDVYKFKLVRHVLNVSDIFVSFFSLTAN